MRQTKIRSSFCYKCFTLGWRCRGPDIQYITLIVTERKGKKRTMSLTALKCKIQWKQIHT